MDFRVSHGGEAGVVDGGGNSVADDTLPSWLLR